MFVDRNIRDSESFQPEEEFRQCALTIAGGLYTGIRVQELDRWQYIGKSFKQFLPDTLFIHESRVRYLHHAVNSGALPFYAETGTFVLMKSLPAYPSFAPMSLEMARIISPQLVRLPDGLSEYSFAGFYLFRERYNYQVSFYNDLLILSGELDGKRFFITPCCSIGMDVVDDLFKTHDYWKLVSPAFLETHRSEIDRAGYRITEDRDNYDYLYNRSDLATLSGKRFHKKRNHVNAFENTYPIVRLRPLIFNTDDALEVLDIGRRTKSIRKIPTTRPRKKRCT